MLGLEYKHPIQRASPQTGKERLSGGFKHSSLFPCPQKCVDDRLRPRVMGMRLQAHLRLFVVDARLDPLRCPRPTPAAARQGRSRQRPFSVSLQEGPNPQTSHPALLFPPKKCFFACGLGTYGSAGEKGEAAPRVVRLQKVPENKRLILMSQLRAGLAVSFRKSSSFMQRRKQMEIAELI